jgi:RecJ-like exonuclease
MKTEPLFQEFIQHVSLMNKDLKNQGEWIVRVNAVKKADLEIQLKEGMVKYNSLITQLVPESYHCVQAKELAMRLKKSLGQETTNDVVESEGNYVHVYKSEGTHL